MSKGGEIGAHLVSEACVGEWNGSGKAGDGSAVDATVIAGDGSEIANASRDSPITAFR